MKFKYRDEIIEFIRWNQVELGLLDFDYRVGKEVVNLDKAKAECSIEEYDKRFHIVFDKSTNNLDLNEVYKITLHEIIHGLLLWHINMAKQCESSESYDVWEELFINKIVDIIWKLNKGDKI